MALNDTLKQRHDKKIKTHGDDMTQEEKMKKSTRLVLRDEQY